ncbi:MAG TPA: C39 family peptidase [Candidatus Mediterraneibacter stercoravium]|uniref:C39 family peptidase n=1 Tax=Candidatus Mediterraneibacter stercoravium TaxID=2838685 RepID=A0A9D2G9I7_9FIRM|nr:C39 family peptidase [Candidatus Mediterraneibacter stercoravium]
MKKRVIKIGVLIIVFAAALVISSLVINRGSDDEIVDMGAPVLPRISFTVDNRQVNILSGYVGDMEITAMRDTITPLESDGTLQMNLEADGNEISSIKYEVYSLDGGETYKTGELENVTPEEPMALELNDALGESVQEAVLKVILTVGEEDISYYTRIERPDEITAAGALEFAQDFHTKALEKSAAEELAVYLEPGEESDNSTYQTVNIHSDITHIQWGDLNPEVQGEVRWSIKESNSVYTSLLAKYQVSCEDDNGETQMYDIKEFFRVRLSGDTVYLLDYNRDMQQVFNANLTVLDEDGIQFGIASNDIQYMTSDDDTIVAFVRERDLWLYDQDTDELSQVFSFSNQEGQDERSRNDQHAVRIISLDDSGNMAFAVYGYMNRGIHEGEVGVGIYYFNIDSNAIEEKAFIPSTKSFAIAEDELGKMVYYNHEQEMLYVLADGTLYQINLKNDDQTVLAEDLEDGQYAVSDDGHLMAYQTGGSLYTASEVTVMNLENGDQNTIQASEGDAVRPLGFVNGDFIYGKISSDDAGTMVSGEEITPMYEIEIRNSNNEAMASYSFTDSGIYITDILVEGNMVTLNRVKKSGNVYQSTDQEFITNNEERSDSTIALESYTTERMQSQMRLTFENGIKDTEPKVLRPNELVSGEPLTITLGGGSEGVKYYVYGMGELEGIYDRAGYAIQEAEEISGVVISSDQAYIWEKGNRDLAYSTEAETFRRQEGESSLEACERYMEQYNAHQVDLTGCTLDQVLYVINKGCPMIALTNADHAILLTGYTRTDITYIDPDTGEEQTVGVGEMEKMVQGSGNTFIGYIQ